MNLEQERQAQAKRDEDRIRELDEAVCGLNQHISKIEGDCTGTSGSSSCPRTQQIKTVHHGVHDPVISR